MVDIKNELTYTSVVKNAVIAQLVERIHGKDEVSGSNPDRGSKNTSGNPDVFLFVHPLVISMHCCNIDVLVLEI